MTHVRVGDVMGGVTLNLELRGSKPARVRLAIGSKLLTLAAKVIGCGIDVRTAWDQELEFTEDGVPRALSTVERFKGYHSDAFVYGADLVIKLDGVEQQNVIAYDIDSGMIAAGVRSDVYGVVERRAKGVVTVERKTVAGVAWTGMDGRERWSGPPLP